MHAVRITVVCDECVRIEYSPRGRFCDYPSLFAINGPAGDAAIARAIGSTAFACQTVSADAGSPPITLQTSRFTLTYTPDGRPPHAGNMCARIEHPSPPTDVPQADGRVLWTPEARNLHNLGGTLNTLDGLRGPLPVGEGLLARDGWHLVDDSTRHLLVNGWAATREQVGLAGNTDWYLFAYGADYASALRAMTVIAGRVPMPRKYALGAWYSRYWQYTADEFRGVVDEFEVHGFPLDVLVLDMDWHKPGWTGWSWNRELIPNPGELLSWLHSRGLAVTLNLHPADGVGPHEDQYAPFMHALGRSPDGTTVPFDAGDKRYMHTLFEHVHRPLESSASVHPPSDIAHPTSFHPPSVDFWWVDWQQDRYVRSIPGLTNLRWLNHLYFQHTSRPASGSDRGLRGLSFSRWAADEGGPQAGTEWGSPATGGWGDHRYPIHFSGDAHTGWEMLAFQVPFTATAGNIGCFFWSHDIGGHFGPRLEETTTRWVQFGALSAALRLHSARSATLDRRPWTYEERFCDAMRGAFELRSRLMPYIYSCVRDCHERALPLLRPMYLSYPHQPRAYGVPGQFLIGDHLLVAPIVAPGLGERCVSPQRVWFPPALAAARQSAWYNLYTGERHEGGEEAIVAAPIDQIPLYIRAGVLLPAQPATHRMATEPLHTLVLHCFPGEAGDVHEHALYEDDGLSMAHERGECASTTLRAAWNRSEATNHLTLHATIGPTRGHFAGQPDRRLLQLRLGGVHRAVQASVNGSPAQSSFDPDSLGGLLVVDVGAHDVRVPMLLEIVFEPADPRPASFHARAANLGAAIGLDVSIARHREVLVQAISEHAAAGSSAHRTQLLGIGAGIGAAQDDHVVRFIDSLGWVDSSALRARVIERLGISEAVLSTHELQWSPTAGQARTAEVALPAADLAAPPIGLRRDRIVRFECSMQGVPLLLEHVAASAVTPLSEFSVVGPFAWDWHNEIAARIEPPEHAESARNPSFTSRDGASIFWRPAMAGAKWPVDLRSTLGQRDGLGYASTTIHSPGRQHATLRFAAGDKLEAFLNGTKIITLDDHSAHGATSPDASITLEPGDNVLLIKLSDGGGGWGFSVSVDGTEAVTHRATFG